MDPITWPANLAPNKCAFYLQAHRGGTESPFTRVGKFYGLSAPRWIARYSFVADEDVNGFAPQLDALIDRIAGLGVVRLWDFRRPAPQRGYTLPTPTGVLTHAAAAKGATTMTIRGFFRGSPAFSQGDYVGGDGRAHRVQSLVFADQSGNATIEFRPPLRAAITEGTVAVVERVTSPFRLAQDGADDAGMNETEVGKPTPYTLTFVEELEPDLGA